MKITFLLPGSGHSPIGGYKVIYEYANCLAQKGFTVMLVHPAFLRKDTPWREYPKKIIRYIHRALDLSYRPNAWFDLSPGIVVKWTLSLHPRYIPEADIVVASAWQTAEWVKDYDAAKGSKYYFIHDYEHFMVADPDIKERMAATFRSGMFNIVTSPAGRNMVSQCNAPVHAVIPNGLDFTMNKLVNPIESEARTWVGFPNRHEPVKGSRDAVAALAICRSRLGERLRVWSFGGPREDYLPDWIEYHQRPSDEQLCELYNRSMIFVVPSHYEGWGLPGAEAMACGAALVSTDNGGVNAYAEHENHALLSPPRDIEGLAKNVMRLVQDRDFRIRLAGQGYRHIKQFSWERAVSSFLMCLEKASDVK